MQAARTLFRVVLLSTLAATGLGQTTYYWTGVGSTGFQNDATPAYNGTEYLFLFGDLINKKVTLNGTPSVDAIFLQSEKEYDFVPLSGSVTLSIGSAIIVEDNYTGRIRFDSNIDLALSSNVWLHSGDGSIVISGHITDGAGSSSLTLMSNGTGVFIFNNTDTGNSYTGGTTLDSSDSSIPVSVAFWNSSPFGTGGVQVYSSSTLIAHGTQNLANDFTFATTSPSDIISFKSWDGPLTLSGDITLDSSTILHAQNAVSHVDATDNTGSYPMPGAAARNPIIFTGQISGSGPLTISGPGVIIFDPASGSNTYTGGTTINGSLVFGSHDALPTSGSIFVNPGGYAGFVDMEYFSTDLGRIDTASTGAVGVDTLPDAASTTTLYGIDLSGFTNSSIRIGTATSAILAGTITPQGNDYQFGNGGGTLYVESNLSDIATGSQVVLSSGSLGSLGSPLKVFLQSSVSYTGGTVSNNGFLIFDSYTLPSTGTLTAAGGSTNVGGSYIGMTGTVDTSVSAYLSKFDTANTWGIVGFDTSPDATSVATFSADIDLSAFNNGVLLGTATAAVLSGTITPASDDRYRFTAGNGGTLTVTSDLSGSASVELGSPSSIQAFSDGTVVLNPTTANTYTGGTFLNTNGPLTLLVGGTTPLGTGALTVQAGNGAPVGLEALESGYDLANDIVFATPGSEQSVGQLVLNEDGNLTLSGAISGPGALSLVYTSATLSHDNSNFTGEIDLLNSSLYLYDNHATGTATLYFNGTGDYVNFGGSATTPTIYGIKGDSGVLDTWNATTLTFDLSNPDQPHEFGGSITSEGAPDTAVIVTAGAPQSQATQETLYLYGQSDYTGGTTITGYGILGLGSDSSAGTGMITVNALHGGLVLNQGVTLTNQLTFTAGSLAGFGTYVPANLTSITFGTGQKVVPGLPVLSENPVGTLTFGTETSNLDVVFADGGTYVWSLQDVARSDGFSQLVINGNLAITAASGGFTLELGSYDFYGESGYTDLVYGQNYSFVIATTTGVITGFDPSAFTIDASGLDSGLLTGTQFTLSATSNTLVLSFTPVPEPSTWALYLTGLTTLGLAAWRRRARR